MKQHTYNNKNGAVLPITPYVAVNDPNELLQNPEKYLEDIPKENRKNIFMTLAHLDKSAEGGIKSRDWTHQGLLFFDIDKIDLEQADKYVEILSRIMRVEPEKIISIKSGNGLHIVIKLKTPFQNKKMGYFKTYKRDYDEICNKLDISFGMAGLKGLCDRAVFSPKKMFRVPLTTNFKPGIGEKPVEIINPKAEAYDIDLRAISGLKLLKDSEQITNKQMSHIKVDTQSVEAGCDFLKHVKKKKGDVSEPFWFAAISLTARLKDALKKCIEYSKGHKGFSPEATKDKMERALKSSGPRTCESIDKIWGKCKACPNYKKVKSPIMLKNPDFIASDHVGFRVPNQRGVLIAQHEDLLKYYKKSVPFKNINEMHYRYEGKYWRARNKRYIEAYAQEHFKPAPKAIERSEFKSLVQCTNLDEMDFFDTPKAHGKVNCKNGIVDIKTGEIIEHCPSYGFRQMLDFDYDPSASAPMFTQLLKNVTVGDSELEHVLLEYFGYCLSGVSPSLTSQFLVLSGEGANGKSTLLDIFQELLGNSVSAVDAKHMASDSSQFFMHQMCKALVNICEELPSGGRGAAEQWEAVKRIASGNPITAAEKGKASYVIKPKTKLIFTCNELPSGGKANHGWFRKMLIVPFNAKFTQENGNLDVAIAHKIIESEMAGVLNMCIEGFKRLKTQGWKFSKSHKIDQIKDEFKEDRDSVLDFYQKALTIDPRISTGESIVQESSPKICTKREKTRENVARWVQAQAMEKGETPKEVLGFKPISDYEKPQVRDEMPQDSIEDIKIEPSEVPFMIHEPKRDEYFICKKTLWKVYAEYTKERGAYPLKTTKFYSRLVDIVVENSVQFSKVSKSSVNFKGKATVSGDDCVIGTKRIRINNKTPIIISGLIPRDDIDYEILTVSL